MSNPLPTSPRPTPDAPAPVEAFRPIPLLLACLLPGLGHVASGHARRGILAGTGVLSLFVGGILVGGIDAIDRREDPLWFIGQAFVGPLAFGLDHYHQTALKVRVPGPDGSMLLRSAFPDEGRDPATGRSIPGGTPPNTKSIGRMNELGTLAACLAGMMNIIVIIDAGWPSARRRRPSNSQTHPAEARP